MIDNILFLELRARTDYARTLRVAKPRGNAHDLQPRKVQIDSKRLRVIEALE
jgi:hypothetical protein